MHSRLPGPANHTQGKSIVRGGGGGGGLMIGLALASKLLCPKQSRVAFVIAGAGAEAPNNIHFTLSGTADPPVD